MSKGAIITLVIVIVIVVGGAIWWYASMSGAPVYQAPATVTSPTTSTTDMGGMDMNMSSTMVMPTSTPVTPAPSAPAATAPAASQPVAATISNFAFSPATITVHKGTKVTWTNEDSAAHTVTGNNGGPASGDIGQGASYSYTFNAVGSFPYHCAIHPYMKGTVTVVN